MHKCLFNSLFLLYFWNSLRLMYGLMAMRVLCRAILQGFHRILYVALATESLLTVTDWWQIDDWLIEWRLCVFRFSLLCWRCIPRWIDSLIHLFRRWVIHLISWSWRFDVFFSSGVDSCEQMTVFIFKNIYFYILMIIFFC